MTDQWGTTVAKYTYDPWGNILSVKDGNNVDVSTNPTHRASTNLIRYAGYRYGLGDVGCSSCNPLINLLNCPHAKATRIRVAVSSLSYKPRGIGRREIFKDNESAIFS